MDEIFLHLTSMLFVLLIGLLIGLYINEPNELENGCIVHNDKIYCEVGNEL